VLPVAGCADAPVSIDSPRLDEADRDTCRAFVDDLPEEMAGEQRRLVSPAAAPGAAWGDPAIVLRCGVPAPDLPDTAECLEANGVGWYVVSSDESDPEADATVTAAGYRPVVTVDVPGDRQPEGVASVTATLAPLVEEHLELVDACA
jgi:hypothetical protein